MAEQTFLSPGFFETEIDLTQRVQEVTGVPGGVVGFAEKGPAFVPVTVGSFTDFQRKFGGLDDDKPATYAAYEFLKNKTALTFVRVLGAGGNATLADISATKAQGTVKNTGFKIAGTQLSVPGAQATATITVTNVSLITNDDRIQTIVDNGASPQHARIIYDTAATTNTVVTGAGTSASPFFITVGCSITLSTAQVAGLIKTAVDSLATAGLRVSAAIVSSTVTLTQLEAGDTGNTTIVTLGAGGGAYASTGITVSATFTGGTTDRRHNGSVQFIAAKHIVTANETVGFPMFSDNVSFNVGGSPGSDTALLVRAMILVPTGTRIQVLDHNQSYTPANILDDTAAIGVSTLSNGMDGKFKLIISSSAPGFDTAEGLTSIRIYTASLNPRNRDYVYNVLNTDPKSFQTDQHLLYAHFPVDPEIAEVTSTGQGVAIMSGSSRVSLASGDTTQSLLNAFGRFDTRYRAARSTSFISQPFGNTEHDLFYIEALDDGAYGNTQVKVSIANLRKSEDPNNPYGTFDVLVRRFTDTDSNIQTLEQFAQCDLNPRSDRYIGLLVGDRKVAYDFDAENDAERRFIVTGRYANKSSYIRVIASEGVVNSTIPAASLPFGFRGVPVLKTSDTMTDSATPLAGLGSAGSAASDRLNVVKNNPASDPDFQYSILPPIPYRFKVTRGSVSSTATYTGDVGVNESVDANLFWGVKFEMSPDASVVADAALNSNAGSDANNLISSYARLLGIQALDTLVTGSGADTFSNNKFSLARVALLEVPINKNVANALTDTAEEHMLGAAYIRNGIPDAMIYTIEDPQVPGYDRITLASILALTSSVYFNRFSNYAKFTNFLYGGFDGVNILDADMAILNDRATSSDVGGKALTSIDIGIVNPAGVGSTNNGAASYNTAVDIITNPLTTRINLLAIPGIRDPLITDYAMESAKNYGQAAYILDIPSYTEDTIRVFTKDGSRPDVQTTADQFSSRAIDNNYAATYFPDVSQADPVTGRRINLPSSVAALAGISYSDKVSYPWYAPAGFSRGALGSVTNTQVRLNSADRDTLYVARINPIARMPDVGYVIFGQKTLQVSKSSLDRLNVRRMLLEVKRIVSDIAISIVFEQNTPATRARFVDAVRPQLAIIQAQQGVESFRVTMDATNNTELDIESNRLNGRIVIVPTRVIEFIAVDFVITNAGVSFE